MNTLPATHRRPEPFADLPSDAIVSRRTQPLGAEISGRNSFTETRGVPLAGSVGPYLLGRQLGRGGMADVFEATEETTGAVVALKVMRPLKAGRRASVECFENEADVMGALNHPNIVALHDRGVGEGGLLYLAMPIVRGDSLRQKITAARHLPPEDRDQVVLGQLLPLFVQLCDAVEHAHRACILHRDLKPSNVLVTPEGQVKLIDWGVAAPLADPVVRSRHQLAARKEGGEAAPRPRFGGTPGYMSPEQIRLHPSGQDERSDVWSLGAILFEIAAWRRLVPGTTSHEVLV
jgi:serine/threonine protein kinase